MQIDCAVVVFDDFSKFRLRIGQLVSRRAQISSFRSGAVSRRSIKIIGIIKLDKFKSLVFLRGSGISIIASGFNPVGGIGRTEAIDFGLREIAAKEIISVVMHVPAIYIGISNFLRTQITFAAVSLKEFFHGLMAATLTPNVRGHVANLDK